MRSILLVEDEKLELEALRDYVDYKKLGIDKVYTARNGRSALECMAEHEPDIVITDIQMPVMNGIKLAERIREEGYQCRIIFLSGYDDFSYVKAGFSVRAEEYILKPFSVKEVETLLSRILEELEAENRIKDSQKLVRGQILKRICEGKEENPEAAARQFFDCGSEEKAWGMLAVYGMEEKEKQQKIASMPEILCTFGEEGNILFSVISGYVSFQDTAERMAQIAEKDGCIAYCSQKLCLNQLQETTVSLKELQEEIFFMEPGEVVCLEEVPKRSAPGIDKEAYCRVRRELRSQLTAGEKEQAGQTLEACLWELRKGDRQQCQREMYGLYLNIRNRLETEDGFLAEEMAQRPQKPELKMLDVYFYAQAKEALEAYVNAVCAFYQKKMLDPKYYVVFYVKDFCSKNYAGICSVEKMASDLGISPNYLRTLFKAESGQTIQEYLTEVRMKQSCEMLKDKRLKIKDVAMLAGYENVSYFNQVFAKRYGVTPNEYRKKN